MSGLSSNPHWRWLALSLMFAIFAPLVHAQERAAGPSRDRPTSRPAQGAASTRPAGGQLAADVAVEKEGRTFVVTRVLDGVTVRVASEDQLLILAGVLVPPGDSAAGERATAFLAALLVGESITVEELPRMGRSARRAGGATSGEIVAIVRRVPDGLCANLEAVRQGFARFDDDDSLPAAEEYRRAERIARQAKKGIWSDGLSPPPPATPMAPQNAHSGGATPQESDAAPDTKRAAARDSVFVTRTGTKYHTKTCPYCRSGATAITLTEARERKLSPCGRCKPPK